MHINATAITVVVCILLRPAFALNAGALVHRPCTTPKTKQKTHEAAAIKDFVQQNIHTHTQGKNKTSKNVIRWKLKYIKRNERKREEGREIQIEREREITTEYNCVHMTLPA